MKKFGILIGIITILIVIAGVYFTSRGPSDNPNLTPPPLPTIDEYFWGNGCPHCKNVDDFINGWDKKDKLKLDKKEVWYNKENAALMNLRASQCNITKNDMGVPLLFTTEGKCIQGDSAIIDYLKSLDL